MEIKTLTQPDRPLIIYDGNCNFCINGMARIRKQDSDNQFDFYPQQTPNLYDQYPQLISYANRQGMRFINQYGQVFCGADAIFEIYRRIGWLRYVTWIYRLPLLHQLFQISYWMLAKNRHRLNFGRSVKCQLKNCQVDHAINTKPIEETQI